VLRTRTFFRLHFNSMAAAWLGLAVGSCVCGPVSYGQDQKAPVAVGASTAAPPAADADKSIRGFGVIDKVITAGPELVFQADGYRIRIVASTEVTFSDELKSLADVGTNTWVSYEGKRDATGALVATQAKFIKARQGKIKAIRVTRDQEAAPRQESIIDADGNFKSAHAKVRMSGAGGWCGWHRVPADQALQERVRRVGVSIVPEYQKRLALDDPSSIPFRFYVIDEKKIRSAISCSKGLVLVPRTVAERLKNDDQLAAVLADGVALNVQWQSSRLIAESRALLGAELAGFATEMFVPGAYLATIVGETVVAHGVELRMQEQRGRMALAMMADAGYNPRQAPEAWRLLAPGKLPANMKALKYPGISAYQLEILRLQYGMNPPVPGGSEARQPHSSANSQ
jgi:hypothetical protein